MTDILDPETEQTQLSLSTAAARNLATTTKSVPQMQGISSRWLLRTLPWVEAKGGAYRVNRRRTHTVGDGRVEFVTTGAEVRVIPEELRELAPLRGFDDAEVLAELANRFEQREYAAGESIVEQGGSVDRLVLIAHGKVHKLATGDYGDRTTLGVLADGDHIGDEILSTAEATWAYTAHTATRCTALILSKADFLALNARSEALRAQLAWHREFTAGAQDEHGEAAIELAAGHRGEPELPGTFVDYELTPREYELSVAQTVLRVHTRVSDLYNDPMNQAEQQLRLTIEALRERQERELVNNREFGLLHNADLGQRIHTRGGPPTPDDMDELLATVWKEPTAFLAHPKAIAAFGQACSRRGVYPQHVDMNGQMVPAWRGVPVLPCGKIPISDRGTTSIMLLRTGEDRQGVIGLHQTGLPDEYRPGLSVRNMGTDAKAITSYLVTAYYSAAVLMPDALGILEDVELGRAD
ncbi:cAMP-binding proteins-catabolite gene activator and regulatory subunit of cAMP-dependent protein kinases [Alloactinosynnema sp. L-07]|uniref:family 2B encapsulin nanocompartment shell protein n=1 Tax=Alloactinosynnema sp. L-07 TaxID=1653480 RepID=UPI00065EF53A|nr:family 2B encapsulin nanocompartment shell protein [Alloactinosynnema sp. L-07]CRK56093.1 cAMP-binding proteins-catabolite gene activator and regulatory subunit of cAMP-dependent protein kinases [Alloactinosynnema sp. L-07]